MLSQSCQAHCIERHTYMILNEEQVKELTESIANIACDLGCTPSEVEILRFNTPILTRDSKGCAVEISRRGRFLCVIFQQDTNTGALTDQAAYHIHKWAIDDSVTDAVVNIADIRDPEWLDKLVDYLYVRWEGIRNESQAPIQSNKSEYIQYLKS